ncbi:hypothetical protein P5673_031601 [Acropora cervicornis]|uniref:Uncharacterized protein n=1 Tax=Acropora cervicornis TaxID=6130 RepID=A0AAD9PSQ1_ACRCE|nr:hypothetical protein P5673_031601 [Acropora cervicornis]
MGKPLQTIQAADTTGPKDRQHIIEQLREIPYLQTSCSNFRAGSIATKFTAWTDITNDKEILSDVSGVKVECTETPVQH